MGDFIGITGDGWIAIATAFMGAALLLSAAGVYLGIASEARRVITEQEVRDVRRYYIDDGLWALSASIDEQLQTIRQNYTASAFSLTQVRAGQPGPSRIDLPRLAIVDEEKLAVRGMRPAETILEFGNFDTLLSTVIGKLRVTHQSFVTEVETKIRTSYLSGNPDPALADELEPRIKELFFGVQRLVEVASVLEAAGLRLQKLRVSRFSEIEQVASDDPQINELKEQLERLSVELSY